MPAGRRSLQRGFTFAASLVLVAIISLGLAVAGPLWLQQSKRASEQELLRIGALYARALASYRNNSPGSLKQFPQDLDALLLDARFVGTVRHLRKLYADPVNAERPWGVIVDHDQRIIGVYSLSDEAPLADGAIDLGIVALGPARRYSDWKFTPRTAP